MWFDQFKIQAIEQALRSGNSNGLSGILPENPSAFDNPNPPTFCPKCGKLFTPRRLNYTRTAVPVCPDGHGVWLSSNDIIGLKQRLKDGFVAPEKVHQARGSFRVFVILMAMGLGIFNAFQHSKDKKPVNYKMSASMEHNKKVGQDYWPTRDYSQWNVMPENQNVIIKSDELAYFQEWMVIANEGIVNRLNMHDALLVKRPSNEYWEAYDYFLRRQKAVLSALYDLVPPERLETFHDFVVQALNSQIDFYDDFVRRKMENPSVELNQLLQHPNLVTCDKKLWAAFYEFARLYPNRDTATNNAIEQRLCWLDLI